MHMAEKIPRGAVPVPHTMATATQHYSFESTGEFDKLQHRSLEVISWSCLSPPPSCAGKFFDTVFYTPQDWLLFVVRVYLFTSTAMSALRNPRAAPNPSMSQLSSSSNHLVVSAQTTHKDVQKIYRRQNTIPRFCFCFPNINNLIIKFYSPTITRDAHAPEDTIYLLAPTAKHNFLQ